MQLNLKKMDIDFIKRRFEEISDGKFGGITSITPLAGSGSSRRYFRITAEKGVFIGTHSGNVDENDAFLTFTGDFQKAGLPVPEIFAVSDDRTFYIQSDFGDVSLFSIVQSDLKQFGEISPATKRLYEKVLCRLVEFQLDGHDAVGGDYGKAYPAADFCVESLVDDMNYFRYYFLKTHKTLVFNEERLRKDFTELASLIVSAPYFFMYRDFQSRNIMIRGGEPYFIDYQGGRRGPLQYDVVSLLYQAKARLKPAMRDELLGFYKKQLAKRMNPAELEFDKHLDAVILLRLMQVLGAYGFRGLIEKKQHFVESIPFALREIVDFAKRCDIPAALPELKATIAQLETLSTDYPLEAGTDLVIDICSFSYKNGGVPNDTSGNGGGFVFDCRAIPNPGRLPEFKTKTGLDDDVSEWLENHPETHEFFGHAAAIVCQSIDNYVERHFAHLSIGFGCTGGQHRSVYFAQKLAEFVHEKYPQIAIRISHTVQQKNFSHGI